MRLTVVCTDQSTCYVAVHASDATALFGALGSTRHWCRALRVEKQSDDAASEGCFVGWAGDAAAAVGTLGIARPFAACLGLVDGETISVSACADVAVAPSVMVQPCSVDDWEVVELQAGFIEENLLSQISVLAPRMVFTAWIHGQVPVQLRVDPKDQNTGECFLLSRDSELHVETRQRATDVKAVSIFGGAARPGAGSEPAICWRVLGITDSLAYPGGFAHPDDLEKLCGCRPLAKGHLLWLEARRPAIITALGAESLDGAVPHAAPSTRPQLLHVCGDASVLRGHVVISASLAAHAQIPRFSVVRLWRCCQVPVWVPHVELVLLGPSPPEMSDAVADHVRQSFEALARDRGEIDLMDGATVCLRLAAVTDPAEISASAADGVSEQEALFNDVLEGWVNLASNDELSDIEDLYEDDERSATAPVCGKAGAADDAMCVIDEIDLGLDDRPILESELGLLTDEPAADVGHGEWQVLVKFAGDLAHIRTFDRELPPFVRISARSLAAGDVYLSVSTDSTAKGGLETTGADSGRSATLSALWAAVPGLRQFPDSGADEVVRVLDAGSGTGSLDALALFAEAEASLQSQLQAQLGLPACALPSAKACLATKAPAASPSLPSLATPGGVAVLGPVGAGKTMLCRRACAALSQRGVLPLEVSCAKLGQPNRKFKALLDWLRGIFCLASWCSPSIVLLDDLNALCPEVESGAPNLSVAEDRSVIVAELLLDLLHEVRASGAHVAIVGTMLDYNDVHKTLRRAEALEHKIKLRPPHMKERPEVLGALLQSMNGRRQKVDEALLRQEAFGDWGGRVDGYSVADLCRLVERAATEAIADTEIGVNVAARPTDGVSLASARMPPPLSLKHVECAIKEFVPTALADQTFFSSDVGMADVGGLLGPKNALIDMLTLPTKYAALVDRAPVRGRKGLMLVGPPGCGKTMLVHAAVSATKGLLRFLTVKGPELLSKYIGASEAGVRQVFERAQAAAPSVVFFDEIEALAPKRGADSTGVTDRVVNQMLCYLDGVEDRGRVYVVAATGRPDLVDAALMRPGRFDKICYCGLPSDDEKLEICEILARKHGMPAGATSPGHGQQRQAGAETELRVQLRHLVTKLPRLFTSADLNALFSSAKIEAISEAFSGGCAPAAAPSVTMAHLHAALVSAKASISEADERRYARVFAPYRPGSNTSQGNSLVPGGRRGISDTTGSGSGSAADNSPVHRAGVKVALA